MKSKTQRWSRAVALALPLALLATGCNDKRTASASTEPTVVLDRTNTPMADADNSRLNVRDRTDATLTPGDQGNTPGDREITQQIRKSLVSKTNDYSVTARNIKIITVDGKVTLRGPVKSDAEKTGIATLAKTVAGEANVEDQLEVKTNP